jgi:uncharacterized membrane protein
MHKGRLEAFTDGVMAIIITIMVLELKVPHGGTFAQLLPLTGIFFSYVLSFTYVGIYWNNHHHTMQAVHSVNGSVLWGNLHLLFWLSLLPFTSGWMGENHFAREPTLLYGFNLLMCAVAYTIWARLLVAHEGPGSAISKAFGDDKKGKISLVLYFVGLGLTFLHPLLGFAAYVAVAVIWFIPDQRIEKVLKQD